MESSRLCTQSLDGIVVFSVHHLTGLLVPKVASILSSNAATSSDDSVLSILLAHSIYCSKSHRGHTVVALLARPAAAAAAAQYPESRFSSTVVIRQTRTHTQTLGKVIRQGRHNAPTTVDHCGSTKRHCHKIYLLFMCAFCSSVLSLAVRGGYFRRSPNLHAVALPSRGSLDHS